MRKKLAMMLATLKKKRKFFCEVEYLESTGTQYINTGLLSTANSKVDCVFGFSSMESGGAENCAVFGGRSGTTNNTFTLFKLASGNPQYFRFDYNGQLTVATASQMAWNTTSKYRFQYTGVQAIATNVTTGESIMTTRAPASSFTPVPICLFCVNYSSNLSTFNPTQFMSGRIYKYWYTDGTNTIDLIPVLDWNMRPAMYDKISGQFFYNANTTGSDFSYGREVHYVEYLETTSQGTSSTTKPFINTLVKYWPDFEIGVKLRESASNVCLSCGSGAYRLERINVTNPYWRFQGGGSSYNYDSTIPITEYHELKWKDGKISCDGVELVSKEHLLNEGTDTTLFTNSPNASGNTIYPNVVYFLKMWNPSDGTLVRDFKPAIDENGVGFMFDRVTHTCFLNQGTGAFSYPAREVEYLQSDGARIIGTGVTVDDTCGYDVKWMALNSNDTIIIGTKGSGDSRWVLSGSNNPNVNLSWNTSSGGVGLGLNKIQTAQMNYLNDRKRFLNDTPLTDITTTLSANASTYNVGIFAGHWGSSTISLYSTCRIYYAKISKGTGLIRDFIPMVKDGSPCLYDKVGGLYYFGTGTGTFTTGRIVEPEYE